MIKNKKSINKEKLDQIQNILLSSYDGMALFLFSIKHVDLMICKSYFILLIFIILGDQNIYKTLYIEISQTNGISNNSYL